MANKKLPTIIHIHGAAYLRGLRELYQEYCRILANEGYCVVNLEYTSGHRKGFPKPVFDFYRFFKFAQNDDIANHIDFDKIILSGDSSGGHVASLVANLQTNPKLKGQFGLTGGPDVKGCILICPMMGVYKFKNMWPKERFAKLVFKKYYTSHLKNLCHNLETITNKFPPSIIISSANDFIKLHAFMFTKIASDLNLCLEHYCITTGRHLAHCSMIAFPYDYESQVAIDKIKTFAKNLLEQKLECQVKDETINFNSKFQNFNGSKNYNAEKQRIETYAKHEKTLDDECVKFKNV